MTRSPGSADELLREMQSAVLPVDSPEAVRSRRDNTVAHLKRVQMRARGERRLAISRRRATIATGVLAPFLAAGLAFAVNRARVQASHGEAPATQSTIARAPNAAAAAASPIRTEPVASPVPHEAESAKDRVESVPAGPTRSRTKAVLRSSGSFPAVDDAEQGSEPGALAKPTSTLSEENSLMERAMVASRKGDDRGAIAILDTLLARFPRSILREDAQVERLRALRRLELAREPAEPARP